MCTGADVGKDIIGQNAMHAEQLSLTGQFIYLIMNQTDSFLHVPITVVDSPSQSLAKIIRDFLVHDPISPSRRVRVIRVPRFIMVIKWKLIQIRDEAISGGIDEIIGPAADQNRSITIDRRLAKSYRIKYRIPWQDGQNETHKVSFNEKDWCNNVIQWVAYKVKSISYLRHAYDRMSL